MDNRLFDSVALFNGSKNAKNCEQSFDREGRPKFTPSVGLLAVFAMSEKLHALNAVLDESGNETRCTRKTYTFALPHLPSPV